MDDEALPLRPEPIVAAYLLAGICLLIPLALVGSAFTSAVLWRRGLHAHAATVLVLSVICVVLGVTVLR